MFFYLVLIIESFSLKIQDEIKKKSKKEPKNKKDKKGKGKKKGGKDKKQKKQDKAPSEPKEKPKHLFEVEKIIGAAHIDYELVPNKPKYQIDVICWGSIAKVFTNDGIKILKTIIRKEKAWVPVCIKHYIENFVIDDVKKFQKHIIKFIITSNLKKVGKVAKTDKTKKFYTYMDEADCNEFIEVYDQDPNLEQKTSEQRRREELEKAMKQIIIECANYPKQELVSWLHYPDKYGLFHEIIQKRSLGVEIECKDFVMPCPLPVELAPPVKVKPQKEKKKGKTGKKDKKSKKSSTKDKKSKKGSAKSKKGKKEKKKVNNTVTLMVPAEVFFTDPLMATYRAENEGVITDIFLILSVKHLLRTSQKLSLNPLVVKIKKLSNVPVNILSDKGFNSIYTSYQIPWIANCQSIEKVIKETIKFNEAHIFFNDTVPKIKLIEFVQTQKLFVEIFGIKNAPPPKMLPAIFGTEESDEKLGLINIHKIKKIQQSWDPVVRLAVCTFDLSSLLDNIWDFQEKAQCHAPGLTLFQKSCGVYDDVTYIDKRTVAEINLNPSYYKIRGPLTEDVLLSFGMTLKVEVYLMAPQAASLILNQIPNTFKRIFLILYDGDFAYKLFNEVLRHNEDLFDKLIKCTDSIDINFVDVITGFMIDNGKNFAFFIEGISTGFILSIWLFIEKCQTETGKFFLNTDSAFEQRLYHYFLDVGLYTVTLKVPLHDILADQRLYLNGNVPLPCMEALKKLCLICHSFLFRSILQYNLLPKPLELISLNLEWGVPERWKPEQRKSLITVAKSFSYLQI